MNVVSSEILETVGVDELPISNQANEDSFFLFFDKEGVKKITKEKMLKDFTISDEEYDLLEKYIFE